MQKFIPRRCLLTDFLDQNPPANTIIEKICLGEFNEISKLTAGIIWQHACIAAEYFMDEFPGRYFPDDEGMLAPEIEKIVYRFDTLREGKERYVGRDVSEKHIKTQAAVDARLEEYFEAFENAVNGEIIPLKEMQLEKMQIGILKENLAATSSAYVMWCMRKIGQEPVGMANTIDYIACLIEGAAFFKETSLTNYVNNLSVRISDFHRVLKNERAGSNEIREEFSKILEINRQLQAEVDKNKSDRRKGPAAKRETWAPVIEYCLERYAEKPSHMSHRAKLLSIRDDVIKFAKEKCRLSPSYEQFCITATGWIKASRTAR